jgi:hypothetical protein
VKEDSEPKLTEFLQGPEGSQGVGPLGIVDPGDSNPVSIGLRFPQAGAQPVGLGGRQNREDEFLGSLEQEACRLPRGIADNPAARRVRRAAVYPGKLECG